MSTTYTITTATTGPFVYNGKFENTMAIYGDFGGDIISALISYDNITYMPLKDSSGSKIVTQGGASDDEMFTFKIAGPVYMKFTAAGTNPDAKVTIG